MSAETRHAQEVNELRIKRQMKEIDRMQMGTLDDQNARLERLIRNYRLNRTWRRIMRWVRFKEWVKKNRETFTAWVIKIAGKINPFKKKPPKPEQP